jgi:hypothetical protein
MWRLKMEDERDELLRALGFDKCEDNEIFVIGEDEHSEDEMRDGENEDSMFDEDDIEDIEGIEDEDSEIDDDDILYMRGPDRSSGRAIVVAKDVPVASKNEVILDDDVSFATFIRAAENVETRGTSLEMVGLEVTVPPTGSSSSATTRGSPRHRAVLGEEIEMDRLTPNGEKR